MPEKLTGKITITDAKTKIKDIEVFKKFYSQFVIPRGSMMVSGVFFKKMSAYPDQYL